MSGKGQMWGGRFASGPSEMVQDFTESVSYDSALYRHDIAGSKAHAAMLGKQGVLTAEEAQTICKGLDAVLEEITSGNFTWQVALEDVHMNIENRLTELVGDVGKKLHTGRSRNDQVGLAFRLYVSDSIRQWQNLLRDVVGVLVEQARAHQHIVLPGCTHMQPAQPVSLAHHLLAYATMLQRDARRLHDADKRVRISPLGAAALAGTTYPLHPQAVAEELGMYGVFQNSMDAVSDRDFVAEPLFAASLVMAHLSRICEDIIIWANPAFGFVRLPDAYATGSSIMPQKKNPDVAELIRGKTGRVYGSLTSLLTIIKGLPMTYNRDLQEDKEPFFDTHRTVSYSIELMGGMLAAMHFVPEKMQAALARGFLNATELADYLVGKGLPFREAHHKTGAAVAFAEKKGIGLEHMGLEDFQAISSLIGKDVYAILSYEAAVQRRQTHGGTGPESVARQIAELEGWLAEK